MTQAKFGQLKANAFGQFNQAKRQELGTTLKAHAGYLGMPSGYLGSVETGRRDLTPEIIAKTFEFFSDLKERRKWISVEERLPFELSDREGFERVLVYSTMIGVVIEALFDYNADGEPIFYFEEDGDIDGWMAYVTHWMPMIELPKKPCHTCGVMAHETPQHDFTESYGGTA